MASDCTQVELIRRLRVALVRRADMDTVIVHLWGRCHLMLCLQVMAPLIASGCF